MIKKIEKVVNGFIEEWKKDPYAWGNEIDVQVELASRIKTVLKTLGKEYLQAQYKGYKKAEKFNRLCCEPPIYYLKDGIRKKCFPDIVVFDDIPNYQNPPDENHQ